MNHPSSIRHLVHNHEFSTYVNIRSRPRNLSTRNCPMINHHTLSRANQPTALTTPSRIQSNPGTNPPTPGDENPPFLSSGSQFPSQTSQPFANSYAWPMQTPDGASTPTHQHDRSVMRAPGSTWNNKAAWAELQRESAKLKDQDFNIRKYGDPVMRSTEAAQ